MINTPNIPFFRRKWFSISLLALAEVCALSLWFSATAVIPSLKASFPISDFQASLFSSGVAMGFVLGTLISALFSLADRVPSKRMFTISALIAALANGLILIVDPTSWIVILLRVVTGASMAGIYPVGMKMISTWAKQDAGLLVGLLVGALTFGSAMPHLINTADLNWLDWKATILGCTILALFSALLIQFVHLGAPLAKAPPFNLSLALESWKNKPLRLANFGYFGHMWELYAMWAWIGIFLLESFTRSNTEPREFYASLGTFLVIGVGSVGSILAGRLSDQLGRTTVTMGAMLISGTCAAFIGLSFGSSPLLILAICTIWGITVIADSAQFSTCIIELSPPNILGTMLTIQTCTGFLISLFSIHLTPWMAAQYGWEWAFLPLAVGPLLGTIAMGFLRAHPASVQIAHGNR
ncbi:MAG: MFS transporter [Sneathiellales bacterium]|nr:MFS transporter [Sneathiellales bacterium]